MLLGADVEVDLRKVLVVTATDDVDVELNVVVTDEVAVVECVEVPKLVVVDCGAEDGDVVEHSSGAATSSSAGSSQNL